MMGNTLGCKPLSDGSDGEAMMVRVDVQPLLSILLPVRNAEENLNACLESLAAQTLQEWECWIVDDRSIDASAAIASAWAARDGRFRLRRTPEPGGIVAALETARAAARAPLLARQDADDRSLPQWLERQLRAIQADPALAVLGCLTCAATPPTEGMRRYLAWIEACTDSARCAREIWVESPIVHPTAVIRADRLESVGGYRESDWPEDYDLWLRLHRAGERLAAVPEALYEWNDPPDRLSRTDARYMPGAFLRCKVHHLRRWLAERGAGDRALVVWGAGRDGKRFARAWERELRFPGPAGAEIAAFVDIDPKKIGRTRRGRPIDRFEEARARVPGAFFVAAVGTAGAREIIRAELEASGLEEERDFVCAH